MTNAIATVLILLINVFILGFLLGMILANHINDKEQIDV